MEVELLEGEAAPRRLRGLGAVGEVRGGEGVGDTRKASLGANLGGQRLDRVAPEAGSAPDPFAHPVRAQAIRHRVDRHQADRVDAALAHAVGADDLVRRDLEGRAVELAGEKQARAGTKALDEPRLVEPDRLGRARAVEDLGLDDAKPAIARRPYARLAHLDEDRRLLADPKLARS